MLSKNESALDLIQKINNLKEQNQEKMRIFAEDCVGLYTQINPESRNESNDCFSPSRIVESLEQYTGICFGDMSKTQSEIRADLGWLNNSGFGLYCGLPENNIVLDKTIEDRFRTNEMSLLDKVDNYERELHQLRESEETKKKAILDLELKLMNSDEEMSKKQDELDSANRLLENFKKKCNIGLLEYLEIELKQKENKLQESNEKILENERGYQFKYRE